MTDEEIVAALAQALPCSYFRCDRGAALRALLPVVRRVAEQRAAEELLAAARDDGISTHKLTPVEVLTLRVVKLEALFARAAALTATPNHGTDVTT